MSNVKGLFDELLLKVMLTLIENDVSYEHLRVWGQWVEEIFADLFGLLQLGPSVIRSMQRVITYAPIDLLDNTNDDLAETFVAKLWESQSISHPVKHLRVWLSMETLRMLCENNECEQELDELEQQWNSLSSENDKKGNLREVVLWIGSPFFIKQKRQVPYETLKQEGKMVLEAILYTPLHALSVANTDNQLQLRTVKDVFYHKLQYE